jgi:hypothetical protein
VGRRIEEAIELIEMELRHAAAYVNDAVIPQVRTESISALRSVADAMRKFADRLDQHSPRPDQQSARSDQQTPKPGQQPQPPTQGPRT